MKKNYNYDFILPFFTASDDMRPAMKQVHKDADGYIYATDAHIMIRIPADKVGNEYKTVEKFPNAGKLLSEALNRPDNTTRSIVVDDLIMILSKAKWYKEMQGDDCPDCDGSGEVVCETCGHSHDCERCNGEGEINKRVAEFSLLQEEDYFIVKIDQQYFRASFLHVLAIVAKVAGVDSVEFISNGSAASPALFKFDEVVILLMPYMSDSADMVLKTKIVTK